jgi:hypothetical protein
VAEESGKGIALVILGIVAVIAIVGLVLLFTGARKSVGQFAVPAAKEYGGSIRGVFDPYSRAFSGRAGERAQQADIAAGREAPFTAAWQGSGGTQVGGETYGSYGGNKLVQTGTRAAYSDDVTNIDASRKCSMLSELSGFPGVYLIDANEQMVQAFGEDNCMRTAQMVADASSVYGWSHVQDGLILVGENPAIAKAGRGSCCKTFSNRI